MAHLCTHICMTTCLQVLPFFTTMVMCWVAGFAGDAMINNKTMCRCWCDKPQPPLLRYPVVLSQPLPFFVAPCP